MRTFIMSSLTIIGLALCWEIFVITGHIDISFFPPPHLFILKALKLVTGEFLFLDFLPSIKRFFIAIILSVPMACALGMATGSSKKIDQIFNPFFALTYPLPKVAIFPLILLLFGLGDFSKIVLIAIGMFYLVYINVRNGTKRILDSSLMNIVRIYKISGWNYFYYFLLRGILRDFLVGLKAALGYGLLLVVVSEFSVSKNGIGHFIWQSWDQFRIVDMYAGVFTLCLLGLFISYVLDVVIDKFCKN